jgi:hypothetical protein
MFVQGDSELDRKIAIAEWFEDVSEGTGRIGFLDTSGFPVLPRQHWCLGDSTVSSSG